ncbi:single-stranded DNA-binding protein [Arcanobacterium haemolyticum]|nr:single-stranded DNA-binding protein [Arcanobacterium haemolyticum]
MAGEPLITITGNLTRDPELRYVGGGAIPVCSVDVACTPREKDQSGNWIDGTPMFVRCNVWCEYAENVAETLTKGMRVLATGRLSVRQYEHNGQQRTSLEMQVDEIGPSLRYAQAQVVRSTPNRAQAAPQHANTHQPTNYPPRTTYAPQEPIQDAFDYSSPAPF